MNRDTFKKEISEALRRTQPSVPEGMTERFMERLSHEKAIKPHPASSREHSRWKLWLSLPLAAAAAVALFFLL